MTHLAQAYTSFSHHTTVALPLKVIRPTIAISRHRPIGIPIPAAPSSDTAAATAHTRCPADTPSNAQKIVSRGTALHTRWRTASVPSSSSITTSSAAAAVRRRCLEAVAAEEVRSVALDEHVVSARAI